MPTVKFTSQNRITLPKEVRTAMNIKPDDIIEVIIYGRITTLIPVKGERV
ncbi:AbrB/MazE/SpoVT family DNA-binding domain-containing protein [Nitrospina sp.]